MEKTLAVAAETDRENALRPRGPFKILVVDDEPLIRQTISDYLSHLTEIAAYEAKNAFEGLSLLREIGQIDGVLADINMPGMDGIEFVKRVKERDRAIVAVIITGYPSIETIVDAMRAGASDFLTKPFKINQLQVAMQRLIRERSILLENRFLTEEVKAKKALEEINERLEKKIREQAILFTISDTLSKVRSTRELYQKIVTIAVSLTETQQACFWVANQEVKKLVLVGVTGPYDPILETIDLEDSRFPCVRVAKEGLPMLITGDQKYTESGHGWEKTMFSRSEQVLVPFTIRKEIFGVLSVARPENGGHLSEEALFLLHLLAERANLTVENLLLYESVSMNLHATLKALVSSLEAKDPYTKEHSGRVTRLAMHTAAMMGCTPEELDSLRFAGHLHDIGKIGIRDQILMKPEGLTNDEYDIIRTHPIIGAEIVSHLGLLPGEKAIIRHHHERWDGRGYPDGLCRCDIPLLSRILAVADAFDAITSNRPYRSSRSPREAMKEIKRNAGAQFDPKVVEAFEMVMRKDPDRLSTSS
jgi:putative nucleotidyltransferase with HDIG domain